ncbi:Wzz/FepE/Etk N-terminal domain-containing protein [Priestia megaterium]
MEETISIKSIFTTLKERWKLILITMVFFALISGIVSYYLLTPVYSASTQILVNQKHSGEQIDSLQIQTDIGMINTYGEIIKSPVILQKVIDELNLKQNTGQLSKKISITSQENSQVFLLTVQDSNPANAVRIANGVSEIFQKEIKNIMNIDNISILAKAKLQENPNPIKPNPILNIVIATFIGLLIGIGLAFIMEYLDNTIKSEQDLETLLELPILGSIQKDS